MTGRIEERGGRRENAGRKVAGSSEAAALARYNEAKADHEETKAEAAAFELAIKRGEYLPRASVQLAASTAAASLVQALRSLPDNLEREFRLDPDVVANIEARIDEALADLSKQFEAMTQ